MDRILTWFFYIWIALGVLLNLAGIAGLFMTAPTFWSGLEQVREIYSPFNLMNVAVEMITFSPAIAAYVWRERRRKMAALAGPAQ